MKFPEIRMIKEISENLEMGMLCFYHRETGELETYPDPLRHPGYDKGMFAEEIEKIEENYADFFRIEGMDSRTSFSLMEDFIEEVIPVKLQGKFFEAISRGKPFRRFNELIAWCPEIRRQWFQFQDYRQAKLLVNEGIEMARRKDHPGTVSSWHKELLRIAILEGDLDIIRHYNKHFAFDRGFDKEYYLAWKATFSPEEWAIVLEQSYRNRSHR